MWSLFEKGGPVMWPLFLTSVVSLAVILERTVFVVRRKLSREPDVVESMLDIFEAGRRQDAVREGEASHDYVARVLAQALRQADGSAYGVMLQAGGRELKRFERGLPVLDTTITLAPLLGLLGTVTGMIRSFGLLGGELDAPTAITGGIAEALIATAFGLGVAILSLIPYNYLNSCLEEARHDIEDASARLRLVLSKR